MPEAEAFTPEEQKYFDTKGADGPANDGTPAAPDNDPEAASAASAQQPEPEAAKEEANNPGQFIRRADYEKEISHRKNLDNALREERARNAERSARLEERLNTLQNIFRQPDPEPPQPIDPRVDFQGAWQQAQRELSELKSWRQQNEQQAQRTQQEQAQYSQLSDAVSQSEHAFANEHKDYYEAIDFARKARDRELEIFGFPPQIRQQIINDDIIAVSQGALSRGASPAEVFYNFAMERGFKPAQQQQQQPPGKAATEKLQTIAAGQNAGKSLGATPGTAAPALTLESLANMPDDEFKKIALDKAAWKKLWA